MAGLMFRKMLADRKIEWVKMCSGVASLGWMHGFTGRHLAARGESRFPGVLFPKDAEKHGKLIEEVRLS